jgi:hypothetical protein
VEVYDTESKQVYTRPNEKELREALSDYRRGADMLKAAIGKVLDL